MLAARRLSKARFTTWPRETIASGSGQEWEAHLASHFYPLGRLQPTALSGHRHIRTVEIEKGRFNERNQYFLGSANRCIRHSAAPLDAQAETTGNGGSFTEDVPVLRIDHISIKSSLLGVWQASYSRGVYDFKEMNADCYNSQRGVDCQKSEA